MSPRSASPSEAPSTRRTRSSARSNRNGIVSYDGLAIILPSRYRGASVRVLAVGELIHIYYGEELVRLLVPDRSRHYQPLGRQRRKER